VTNLVATVLNSKTNLKHLYQDCADAIFTEISKRRRPNQPLVLALPGGRSITGIYRIFSESDFDWTGVHFFLVDERMVPITEPESNYKLIMESFGNTLIQRGLVKSENFHPFLIEKGLAAYNQEILRFGKIDLVLLGVGEDGHCAALFPNHHSITNTLNQYITFNDSPKPPKERMSASRTMLSQVYVAFTLFIGESKRDALTRFFNNNVQIEECPIKIVNNLTTHYEFTDLPWKI